VVILVRHVCLIVWPFFFKVSVKWLLILMPM